MQNFLKYTLSVRSLADLSFFPLFILKKTRMDLKSMARNLIYV
jgi:hypothetical protein